MTDIIKKLPFWELLTKKEQEIVKHRAFTTHYEKGALVHSSGNECLGMIFVISGDIRTYMLSEEGREVTLFRIGANDICVLSASCVISQITFETHMTTGQDTDVLIIPSDVIATLEDNVNVKCFLYELATERFSDVMWAMQQILFKRLDQRVSNFLIEEYKRSKSLEIRMTHEQIAQHISSAREAVARMLKQMSDDGLVELRRGIILIQDIDGLKLLN